MTIVKEVMSGVRRVRGPLEGVTEYRLDNGLKLMLMPDQDTTTATVIAVYHVGSRNEGPGESSLAKLLEHLTYKGSRRFNARNGTSVPELMKRIGATHRGYADRDITRYWEELPAEYLELAIAIEADRMGGLSFSRADHQSVVAEMLTEINHQENRPESLVSEQLWAMAYSRHPYRGTPYGSRDALLTSSLQSARRFYHTYYVPNNATLVIAGGAAEQEMMRLAVKYFSRIPRSSHKIPRVLTVEPRQKGERRFEIKGAGNLQRVSLAFHIPSAAHADLPPLQAAARLLGNGWTPSGRLYKRLVDGKIAYHIWCNARDMQDPGVFEIDLELNDGVSVVAGEEALWEVIEALKSEPASDQELSRIKRGEAKDDRLRAGTPSFNAFMVANVEPNWTMRRRQQRALQLVTPAQAQDVVARYLVRDNCTVGCFVSGSPAEVVPVEIPEEVVPEVAAARTRKLLAKAGGNDRRIGRMLARYRGTQVVLTPASQRIETCILNNGLRVDVLAKGRGRGHVTVNVAVKAGNFFEDKARQNLADIVARMLTRGSWGLTKAQLADEMKDMSMSGLDFSVGPYLAEVRAGVVPEDLSRFLRLLSLVMRRPVFDEAELASVKAKWMSFYKESFEEPRGVIMNVLGSTLFAPTDVFFQKPTLEQMNDLEVMTLDEIAAFHANFWTPRGTFITIVGDVEPARVISQVKAAFGDWQGPEVPEIVVPQPTTLAPTTVALRMPDKQGVAVVLGNVTSLNKLDPDYEAIEVARQILAGGTPGARLNRKLCEEASLADDVSCGTWDDSHGGVPFCITFSTSKANVNQAVSMARETVVTFVSEGITEEELAAQVDHMTGKHQMDLDGAWMLSDKITESAVLGLSLDRIDERVAILRSLTTQQVNAAIKRHISTDFTVIFAGDV
jgi:zinc protease